MASVVQYGRRRGSSKRAGEASRVIQPPDLRQITVLTKAEWLRIQDELNKVHKEEESVREVAKQREALHLQSKEVVKLWPNTIAGQRQKKLEAKKIRDELEEQKKKVIDREEAKYQEQKRKEAIEKANTQLFYQNDRVRGLHSGLLLTEVLKERETQIELKQRMKSASKDLDKDFCKIAKTREDEALSQEKEKSLQKKLERQAVVEDLKQQIKENTQVRERLKAEDKNDGVETQRLQELYQWEQRMNKERQAKEKKDLMEAHLEHLSNRDLVRATDAQKQEAEEEQRKCFLAAKQKMMKLRNDRKKEMLREAEENRERIMNKLTVTRQQQADDEEQRIAKAVAERDAKHAQRQWEDEEKKAITAHREKMRQEKEQRDKEEKQNNQESLEAKRESDKIFSEKQQLKAQQIKDDLRKLEDFNARQMAQQSARKQQLRREEDEFQEKMAELMAEEDKQFQQYSQQLINAAAEAQRNVFPLCKAAREGIGGSFGPVSSGVRPVYLVQDQTGAQMPKYVSGTTQDIKKRHEVVDIQEAKKRIGFTW
ncbi:coiled-coil domain-containing protein 173 isoform X1 [Acanthopagrus latus]|uniref:coiled-coil domain-containing protein 173 isoform X1 n=1 Tax=Acanthopagrus latus TaxID=8177 RepID=UPI00187C4760|nr:coiled-coil domain-containing protein 173 isoform X1 [Acanthopagrus latus]